MTLPLMGTVCLVLPKRSEKNLTNSCPTLAPEEVIAPEGVLRA
jgi:hypothetical protein